MKNWTLGNTDTVSEIAIDKWVRGELMDQFQWVESRQQIFDGLVNLIQLK